MYMYLRMLFTMCVSLYTSRIILSTLGYDDYGLYNVVGGIVAMFGFISGSLGNSTSRFITFYLGQNDVEKSKNVFSMTIFIHVIIAVVIVILSETIGLWYLYHKMVIPEGRLFASECLFQLSVCSAFIGIISVPYNAAIIAHEKMSAFAYISIFDVCMKLLIVFLIQISPYDKLIFYAVLLFMIQVIDRIIYRFYCKRKFKDAIYKFYWNTQLFKSMFNYSCWGMLGSFAYFFYTEGINLLINMFCGTAVNAARGVAVQIESVVRQFVGNVQTAINPQIIKSYSQNNICRMHSLIFASSRYCFYLMLLISLPVFINIDKILYIWLGKYPMHTSNFVRIILINVILDTLINPLWIANSATGKVKIYQITVNTISLLFIPISYFVIKFSLIPESLFICTVITTVVCTIARLIIVKKQINLSIKDYWNNVISKILIVSCCAVICPLVSKFLLNDSILCFIINCCICIVCVLCSVFLVGMNNSERIFIISKVRKIIRNE